MFYKFRKSNFKTKLARLFNSQLTPPQKHLETFLENLEKSAPPELFKKYKNFLKKNNYKPLLEILFAQELLLTRHLSPKTLEENISLFRGAEDLATAARLKLHLHQRMHKTLAITDELLNQLIREDDFTTPPRSVLEIGGAWGATIQHIQKRFSPEIYQNYEIDPDYASWAAAELGAIAMPVDGETLSGTADNSIDLAIANNVFNFIPPIKVWSYLSEMSRVIRKNGVVLFNLTLADNLTREDLEYYLVEYFPRRSYSFVPQHFITMNFPADKFIQLRIANEYPGHFKPYFVFRRVAE